MNTWKIEDASQLALKYPTTFFLPSHEEIKSISPGDNVKVIFYPTDPKRVTERMWIMVESINNGKFVGVLKSAPAFLEELETGDVIAFEENNIIDVILAA